MNADGSVDISFDADPNAKAHIIHYGDANTTDPHDAKYMGYTETNSFHLDAKDVPTHASGDKLPFYVQAFDRTGVGATDIDKAAYLNDNSHITGSAWSNEVIITAS